MEKLVRYRKLIEDLLEDQAEFANRTVQSGLEAQVILDENHDRYMLLSSSWHGKKRIRSIIVYMRLYEGKIWIEEDWTENGITPALLKAGVPKEDIVLAFHPPELRPLTEFAAA
jgi:hypothetical protein